MLQFLTLLYLQKCPLGYIYLLLEWLVATHLAFTVNFRFSGITIKTVYKCGVQNGENVEKSLIPLDQMKYKREQAGKKVFVQFYW